MKSKKMLHAFGQIDDEYVDEYMDSLGKQEAGRRVIRKPLLIAAIVALMLFLLGCAWTVLHLQDFQIGQRETERAVFDEYHHEIRGYEEVPQQVLTLSGLEGSPSHMAAREWFDFLESCGGEDRIRENAFKDGALPQFAPQYDAYSLYTQQMADKLDELCEKFGLKLVGERLDLRSTQELMRCVGIDHVLMPQTFFTGLVTGGTGYSGGNFDLSIQLNMLPGEETWPHTVHVHFVYSRKDCLSTDFWYLDTEKEWKQWSFTTASGQTVLILRAPGESWAYLIRDCGDAIMAAVFEPGYNPLTDDPDFEPEWMTDRQVEQVADAIDFSIRPSLPDMDAHAAAGHEAGWEITPQSACYDGAVGRVVFRLTAPEGTALYGIEEGEIEAGNVDYVIPGNWNRSPFTPASGPYFLNFYTCYTAEDGDGLANTADLIFVFCQYEKADDPAFPLDETWSAWFEDLIVSYYDGRETVQETAAAGIWEPEFSFAGSDLRKLEFLDAPISYPAEGSGGNTAITSIQLRSLGAIITCAGENDGGLPWDMEAVMRDGSVIQLRSYTTGCLYAEEFIDLDEVAFLRLPDGTELQVPAPAPEGQP